MPRVTDLGITIGLLPSGPTGSVLDVPGAGLGHATVWRDEPPPPAGRGVARTGVTVLDAGGDLFTSPVPAGAAVLNGAGECTGLLTIREWGLAETPVFLTSTMQLGRVYDAACELLIEEQPAIGADDVIIPVVAECDDSFLSEPRRMQVGRGDVRAALTAARASAGGAAAAEGAVGAGAGMTCLGYKGGVGTASRVLPDGHTVAVVTLTNFGDREHGSPRQRRDLPGVGHRVARAARPRAGSAGHRPRARRLLRRRGGGDGGGRAQQPAAGGDGQRPRRPHLRPAAGRRAPHDPGGARGGPVIGGLPAAGRAPPAAPASGGPDPYAWMRDRDLPAMRAYLAAERAYYDRWLESVRGLRDELAANWPRG